MQVQLGKRKLGRGAQLLVQCVVAALFIVVVYEWPPTTYWAMWFSAAGWIAFSSYWSAAAKNSAAAKDAESKQSRRVHEITMQTGLLLLFIAVPGLRQSFRPEGL